MIEKLVTATGADISDELARLAERVRPSVVEIRSSHGAGAGVIWSAPGLVITNHHVASSDQARVTLADGRSFSAAIVRRDPDLDLAAIQLPADGLPAAPVGDSTAVRVGQLVIAVGNPFGLPRAMTIGIISGSTADRNGHLRWRTAIQSGVDLRPGNSGGPLLDVTGQVVAINSMVSGPRLALSIPSHAVTAFLADRSGAPYLGVTVQAIAIPPTVVDTTINDDSALLVTDVANGSPADIAGLLPGDLLLTLADGSPAGAGESPRTWSLIEPGDLAWALAQTNPGHPLVLQIMRAGYTRHVTVTPVPRP